MSLRLHQRLIVLSAIFVLALTACGTTAEATTTAPPTPTQAATATTLPTAEPATAEPPTAEPPTAEPPTAEPTQPTTFYPIPAEMCEELKNAAAQALGVEFTLTEAPFEDGFLQSAPAGTGCLLMTTGTGNEFANLVVVGDAIQSMLGSKGWVENQRYAADGPTGSVRGYWNENRLAIVTIGWVPSADANCPQDQPISACPLRPDQQLWSITLAFATLPPGVNPPGS